VAILGAIALGAYNRALDHRLASATLPAAVTQAIEGAKGKFVPDSQATVQGEERNLAEAAIKASLAESIRLIMLLAAALALAGAACAAIMIPPQSVEARPSG